MHSLNRPCSSVCCFAIVLTSLGCGSHSTAASGDGLSRLGAAASDGNSTQTFRLATFRDPKMRNMESHTALVPEGWTAKGSAWWPSPKYPAMPPSRDIVISSPTGLEVHVRPLMQCAEFRPVRGYEQFRPPEGAADAGKLVLYRPDTLQQWKQFQKRDLGLKYRGASVTVNSAVIIPELQSVMEKQLEPIRRATMPIPGVKQFFQASALGFTAEVSLHGEIWEELIVMGIFTTGGDLPVGRQLTWMVEPSMSFKAPKGKLTQNLPLLMTIANSVRPTPGWLQMRHEHMARIWKINLQAVKTRHRIWSETFRDLQQMHEQGRINYNAAQEESHRKFINCIRGVQDFEFNGEVYQLPHEYEYAWGSDTGLLFMTDEAGTNPNTDLNGTATWKRLRKIR